MTRSVAEANIAISRIRDMPYGIARSTASAAELDRITAEGPPEARAYALFTTVEGSDKLTIKRPAPSAVRR